jgi:hypothetical protein
MALGTRLTRSTTRFVVMFAKALKKFVFASLLSLPLVACWNPMSSEMDDVPVAQSRTAHLTVSVQRSSAAGIVTSEPAGISCTPNCYADFAEGTVVKLTAQASQGWKFDHWSGDCTGNTEGTSVTLDYTKVCDAVFVPVYVDSDAGSATSGAPDAGTADSSTSATSDPSADSGATSVDPGVASVCCAPVGSDANAGCPTQDASCCLATTLLECKTAGGKWTSVSECNAAGPSC